MKTYTEEDLKSFERNKHGYIVCPSGDYSQIKEFEDNYLFNGKCSFGVACSFSERCSFGEGCSFSEWCSFSEGCSFSEWCSFGVACSFGVVCSFGEGCSFSKRCSFGEECSFGEKCSFGEGCSFSEWCSFGEECSFGKGCSFENGNKAKDGYPFMAFTGAGTREGSKVYFFNCEDDIIVRCGCWCSNLEDFRQRVKEENADPLYLVFADIVEKRFNNKSSYITYLITYLKYLINF